MWDESTYSFYTSLVSAEDDALSLLETRADTPPVTEWQGELPTT